ncbi:MAG: hypothetical protein KBD01_13195 [Acidobacteria bacterium]|nr:hypothetical protein [Acidobacteriota bacterium]
MIDVRPYDADADLVATAAAGEARLRVARPAATFVVLGAGSHPDVELHLGAVREDRVPVFRRPGGGCAVVLDPGNVVVSVAAPARAVPGIRSAFERISAWLIAALAECGVPGIEMAGVSDLALGDRKVAGAAIQRGRDALYYSASILVDPRLESIERYLRHPPREPEYRRGRRHRDFLRPLSAVNRSWTAETFRAILDSRLQLRRLSVEARLAP